MLSIGIVGLPNVGKSTLFKALTKNPVDISNYPFCTIDPNVGIVQVPDARLEKLAHALKPKKTTPTVIEFHDIAGLVKNASRGEGLGNAFLSHIRGVDAVCEIVRCFPSSDIAHVEGSVDPWRDIGIIHTELALSDLDLASKALEKAASEAKSGRANAVTRRDILQCLVRALESDSLPPATALANDECLLAKELSLLTPKPLLVVFNLAEHDIETPRFDAVKKEHMGRFRSAFPGRAKSELVFIASKLECELAELSAEEANEYRASCGIAPSYRGLDALIEASYRALDLITFFTIVSGELRAWTVQRGATAPEAGGRIHTDFEQKFIRAEAIQWDALLETGSWARARELGKLKIAGRDYVVRDGDVLEIKI